MICSHSEKVIRDAIAEMKKNPDEKCGVFVEAIEDALNADTRRRANLIKKAKERSSRREKERAAMEATAKVMAKREAKKRLAQNRKGGK